MNRREKTAFWHPAYSGSKGWTFLVSQHIKHQINNLSRGSFLFSEVDHYSSQTKRKPRLIDQQNKISKTQSFLANALEHHFFWYGNFQSQEQALLLFWQLELVSHFFRTLDPKVVLSKVCVFQSGLFCRLDRYNGLNLVLNWLREMIHFCFLFVVRDRVLYCYWYKSVIQSCIGYSS